MGCSRVCSLYEGKPSCFIFLNGNDNHLVVYLISYYLEIIKLLLVKCLLVVMIMCSIPLFHNSTKSMCTQLYIITFNVRYKHVIYSCVNRVMPSALWKIYNRSNYKIATRGHPHNFYFLFEKLNDRVLLL